MSSFNISGIRNKLDASLYRACVCIVKVWIIRLMDFSHCIVGKHKFDYTIILALIEQIQPMANSTLVLVLDALRLMLNRSIFIIYTFPYRYFKCFDYKRISCIYIIIIIVVHKIVKPFIATL